MLLERKTLDLFGKMLFEKVIIQPPHKRPYPMPDEACFFYVLNGAINPVSASGSALAQEKEAVLMKCGSYFFRMFPSRSTHTYEAVAVHFYPDVLKKVYQNEVPSFLAKNHGNSPKSTMVKVRGEELLQKYFDHILFYFQYPELTSEELLVVKLKELFLLLANTDNAPAVREILARLFEPQVFSFKEIVEAHIFSNPTLEALAEVTNLSVSSFKREFRKLYNDSPGRYFKKRKLEKAAGLLQATGLHIGEIAYDCGFNDLANFNVAFKEKYACTPSAYRSRQLGKPTT